MTAKPYSTALRARNGTVVAVRYVQPYDREKLQNYFRSLSARSRYDRFFGARSELPQPELDRFVHPGLNNQYSLILTAIIDGFERVIGEARYAIHPEASRVELAMSILDHWQGQGIGKALLINLEYRAAAHGAERIYGDTLRTNDRLIGMAYKFGYAPTPVPDDWRLMRFEKHVHPNPINALRPTICPRNDH